MNSSKESKQQVTIHTIKAQAATPSQIKARASPLAHQRHRFTHNSSCRRTAVSVASRHRIPPLHSIVTVRRWLKATLSARVLWKVGLSKHRREFSRWPPANRMELAKNRPQRTFPWRLLFFGETHCSWVDLRRR
ncbi:DNA replication terminus site-binding protein [Striga asiatica]|uniref:DNA replication terminus site-binding protein n=1 Tax=Striga asiatica TaxID=4170 RepID=A0A5A7PU15_STRAF|nr:DNA replication terminus site-binding protein [Striga asiatica]